MLSEKIALDLTAIGPTVDILNANVSDNTTSAATSAVDFKTPTPLEVGFTIKLNCQTGAFGNAYLKIMWSHNNVDFCDGLNAENIATVKCAQQLVSKKTGTFVVKARYAKFQIQNLSGGTIANSASELKLWDMFGAATI